MKDVPFSSLTPQLDWAIDSVQRACQLTMGLQEGLVTICQSKHDLSPVTVADYAAQVLVAHDLALAYPDQCLVAEEDEALMVRHQGMLEAVTEALEGWLPGIEPNRVRRLLERPRSHPSGGFWTLDPVDGTKGFLRGSHYAVALARVEDGRPVLGILGCPRLGLSGRGGDAERAGGTLAIAAQGQGAWARPLLGERQWTRLECRTGFDLSEARLLHSFEPAHTDLEATGRLREALGLRHPGLGMDSQAKYVMLAAGLGDLLVRLLNKAQPDYLEKIWDHAAGQIILEQAGGVVTDLTGRPLDFRHGRVLAGNRGVIASANWPVHEQALAALARLEPS